MWKMYAGVVEPPKCDVEFTEMESQSEKLACRDPTWASPWQRALYACDDDPSRKQSMLGMQGRRKAGLNDFSLPDSSLGGRHNGIN